MSVAEKVIVILDLERQRTRARTVGVYQKTIENVIVLIVLQNIVMLVWRTAGFVVGVDVEKVEIEFPPYPREKGGRPISTISPGETI